MKNIYRILKSVDIYRKIVIKDLLCVEYKCHDQNQYFNFWTECSCLVHCTSGKKVYTSNGQDFNVSKGSTFLMKRGAYSGENFLDEEYCAFMFFLPDSYFRDFIVKYPQFKFSSDSNVEQTEIIDVASSPLLDNYFQSIIHYFIDETKVTKEILSVKLDELTMNFLTADVFESVADYIISIMDEKSHELRQVVEENFASSLKLEEFAELCNMSLSTFKREFQKTYHQSPSKWLMSRKIQLAKNLLNSTVKNVNEIAWQCGFESPSHFIRVFKKQIGVTPSQFRIGP